MGCLTREQTTSSLQWRRMSVGQLRTLFVLGSICFSSAHSQPLPSQNSATGQQHSENTAPAVETKRPESTSVENATTAVSTKPSEGTGVLAPAVGKSPVVPVVAGPERPIGHSLKTPEAQKRIEKMLVNAHQSGQVGPLVPAPAPAAGTKPLVGGQYGFADNGEFKGVPKALVSLGSASPAYGIVVEKLYHRLSLFKLADSGRYQLVKTYRAITGRDPGDKVSRGDLRTPEGIYFVTGRLSDETLPAKYGRLAFTLDYPNLYDKRQRKSGNGIWIHATDDAKRLQKPFDTEGCVVVSNEDITELEQYIKPFEVPVVITKEMTSVNEDDLLPTRKKAIEMVDAWRKAWESSSFESYMTYYSKNFRSLGKNKDQWENFKARLSEERSQNIRVAISEPKIVAFEDQLLVVFLQDYQSEQHSDFGRKFLYLQWEGDRYRIIAEKWYKSSKTETSLRAFKGPGNQL